MVTQCRKDQTMGDLWDNKIEQIAEPNTLFTSNANRAIRLWFRVVHKRATRGGVFVLCRPTRIDFTQLSKQRDPGKAANNDQSIRK